LRPGQRLAEELVGFDIALVLTQIPAEVVHRVRVTRIELLRMAKAVLGQPVVAQSGVDEPPQVERRGEAGVGRNRLLHFIQSRGQLALAEIGLGQLHAHVGPLVGIGLV